MKSLLSALAAALLCLVAAAPPASAQTQPIAAPATFIPVQAPCFGEYGSTCTVVGASNPLPTTAGTTDGANVALGAKADAACADSVSTCSLIALAKAIVAAGQDTTAAKVVGPDAVDAPIAGAPVLVACRASAATPTAMSADNDVQVLRCDRNGNGVARQAPLASAVSGVITSAMTSTTSTSLLAAPASGLRNYVTHIACYNTDADTNTLINVQDGSGGTTIYQVSAPFGGGATLTLPFPLRQPTTATALFVANVTTGAATTCAASGFSAAE